jgi:hypothetical protein
MEYRRPIAPIQVGAEGHTEVAQSYTEENLSVELRDSRCSSV